MRKTIREVKASKAYKALAVDKMVAERDIRQLRESMKPIERKIEAASEDLDRARSDMDSMIIKTLPKDLKRISKEEWEFILYHCNYETSVGYAFRRQFLCDVCGFSSNGFNIHTDQFFLSLSLCRGKKYADRMIKSFPLMKPYIKPTQFLKATGVALNLGYSLSMKIEQDCCLYIDKQFWFYPDHGNTFCIPTLNGVFEWIGQHQSEE